jgi:type III secretory pathway lipoprotein EscJ
MRTVDRLSASSTATWLRQSVDRFRGVLRARRPLVRGGWIVATVLALAGTAYWTALALVPVGTRYLNPERLLAKDDLIKAERALKAHGVDCHIEDRKIVVAADQYDQAASLWNKLELGPRSFDEIREPSQPWSSLIDPLDVRQRKALLNQERMLEGFLNELDGVMSSLVTIQYPCSKSTAARGKPSVFVSVETDVDHRLPPRTVDAILTILTSNLPDSSPQAITVMDRHGGPPYYDPRNPAASDRSRKGAREEEIRAAILSKIGWIRGVQVWVDLFDPPGVDSAAAPEPPGPLQRPEPLPAERSPAVGVNQPLALDEAEPPPPPRSPAPPVAPARGKPLERGRILVNVPRSSYYHMIWTGNDHREPSVEELHAAAVRTCEQIAKAVSLVVPDSWKLEVDTIADDLPVGRRVDLAAASETRRKAMDWGIVAAITALAVALLAALGSWIHVARRPARRAEAPSETRRYRADGDAETNPSERVRELVRRDPETAASVLQRWATQGGPLA